ncbi:DMT family transporter [Ferviditalea candida]|uniref:EamA family transporter n=1 Tax=Ferviditalea candida TaxID=3108399 RepID=A0ABU5ZGM1_9BACL|nr:EamA family transporter [Paenibacillaceae bacterium T2]
MNKLLPIVLLITSTFLMGSSFVVGKWGLQYFSPLILTAYRFLIGGGLLLVVVLMKHKLPPFSLLWKAALIGALQTAGVMACIFTALKYISAGESSILTFTNPLMVLVLSSLLLKQSYHWRQWLGVLIGFAGVVIVLNGNMAINRGTWIGLASAVFWSFATLLVKVWGPRFNMWMLSALQMIFGGIILLILAFSFETIKTVWNPESLFDLLWLAVLGSTVQFTLWFMLLSRMDPSKASSYLFLAPVFGILTGVILLGEPLNATIVIGGISVFAGIFLANYRSSDSSFIVQKKKPEKNPIGL